MTIQEQYTLIICFIVLVMFTLTFIYLIRSNFKMQVTLMQLGQMDDQIIKTYGRKKSRVSDVLNRLVSWLLVLAVTALFGFSLYVGYKHNQGNNGYATMQVVRSASMQTVYKGNTYLTENGGEDRLLMFDLILVRPLPAEEDLQLYDIVVYERDDMQVIHRIVDIEEANAFHAETYYRLQGDANRWPDEYPVYYSQMKAIYRGERFPLLGSFVLFMQSPAGWMCVLIIIATFIATSYVERKLKTEAQKRLQIMNKDVNTA